MDAINALHCITLPAQKKAYASIIWLHGLGANGDDFVPIIEQLGLPSVEHIRFIFPNAPRRPISINQGHVMPGWYDIFGLDETARIDESGILSSERQLSALIDAEQEVHGIPSTQIVLGGFSQGGAMSLTVGLRYPKPLSAIVGLSTYLPSPRLVTGIQTAANAKTEILMIHGHQDMVVPYHYGLQAYQELASLGFNIKWQAYQMGHQVIPDEVQLLGRFLHHTLQV